MDEMFYATYGVHSMLRIVVVLLCILLAWWALKVVRFEVFVKDIKSVQSRVLQIILAIVIGYQLGKFFIDYSDWSAGLRGLF
jgi:uncharacterized integral membrane protein (TIGR02327 family)